jgi:hypothetical protein
MRTSSYAVSPRTYHWPRRIRASSGSMTAGVKKIDRYRFHRPGSFPRSRLQKSGPEVGVPPVLPALRAMKESW